MWAPWRESYVSKYAELPTCIFCKAVNEEDQVNFVVYRSELSIAMLNLYPYNTGHVMVAPKRHVPSIELLGDNELLDLMKVVSLVIVALRECYKPHGFNIGANVGKAAGAGVVGHVHIHIVPRWDGDTNFMPITANAKVLPEDINATWSKMRHCLSSAQGARGRV